MADLEARTLDGNPVAISDAELQGLRARVRGEIVTPDHAAYDHARQLWNGLIDRRPALMVRCSGAADVMASVTWAREHNLLLAVRGGGHNVSGTALADGGLAIDLSALRAVWVDPRRQVARVQGGATIGDVDHETQAFGLAVPLGVVSETGIAGLTLGGGYGWLTRKHGLSIDNVLSADVVAADGRLLHAGPDEHEDLFWALRGGGGNFGVVTSFDFRLHPVGPLVTLCASFHPAARAAEALRFARELMADAPEELGMIVTVWSASEAPMFPPGSAGKPVVVFIAVHSGPLEDGERMIRRLREFGAPMAEVAGPTPFTEAQKFFDEDYPNGMLYYWKSIYLDTLSDAAIDSIVARGVDRPSSKSNVDVWFLGGALGRIPEDATAFRHRHNQVLVATEANWDDPARNEANIAWSRDLIADLQQFSSGGLYQNFAGLGEGGEGLVRDIFGANYERLVDVKTKYDPENLFRVNHNLAPRPGGALRSG